MFEFIGGEAILAATGGLFLGLMGASYKRPSSDYGYPHKRPRYGSAPSGTFENPIIGSAQAIEQAHRKKEPGPPTQTELEEEDDSSSENMSDNIVKLFKDKLFVSPKRHQLVGGGIHHYRNDQYVTTSAEGRVQNEEILRVGVSTQWSAGAAGATRPAAGTSAVAWYNLNPAQGIPAGVRYTAATAPSVDAFFLKHVNCYVELTNLGNIPTYLTLRAFRCKDATAGSPIQYSTNSYALNIASPDLLLTMPAATTLPVFATNYGVPGTVEDTNQIPWLPFTAPGHPAADFKSKWDQLKKWNFQLPAGGRLNLHLSIAMNLFANEALTSDPSHYMKGALSLIMTHHGSPSLTEATTVTGEMVHSGSKIGTIVTQVLDFSCVEDKLSKDERYTAMYNLAANNTIATERHMDVDLNAESANLQVA